MAELELISRSKCFGGSVSYYRHLSSSTQTPMRFAVFTPAQAEQQKVPVLYWLSGLTCTEENFMTKAGAFAQAAASGIMIVASDTSPRGDHVPGKDMGWDFGHGAGFYVNATEKPWDTHYRMFDYVTRELPELVEHHLPAQKNNRSICGHSMGGHGALIAALKLPERYRSVSAFAPIVAPSQCPWGEKAFGHYLGSDRATWQAYDATSLVRGTQKRLPVLIDQGTADKFLETELKTHLLEKAALAADYPMNIRFQEGYDHSYFFIATFIAEHIRFHAEHLFK